MARSRPAQGNNSGPRKLPTKPSFEADSGLSRVSRGTVSRPVPLGKWSPKPLPAPRRVNNPKTVA